MTHPNLSDEQMKHELKSLFPSADLSPQLAARIESLLTVTAQMEYQKAKQAKYQMALRPIAVVAWIVLLCILVLPVLILPSQSGAEMLERMDGAMRGVRSAHFILRTVKADGTSAVTNEDWYQDGKWRMVSFGDYPSTQVFAGGKLWSYSPNENTVTLKRRTSPFDYPSASFSVEDLIGSGAMGAHPPVRDLGERMVNGRRAHQIAVVNAVSELSVFSADPVTNLVFHMDVTRIGAPPGSSHVTGDMEYDAPVPSTFFVPNFPRTAQVIDKDSGIGALRQRWLTGIARQRVGSREIVLRDVQVNAKGDVFVLYTAGHYPLDCQFDVDTQLRDDVGSDYVRRDQFVPEMRRNEPRFEFAGEALEGECFGADEKSGSSHQLTLTFRCTPTPQHGIADMKPGTVISSGNDDRLTATFTIPVHQRITTEMPDYMPYMDLPITQQMLSQLRER